MDSPSDPSIAGLEYFFSRSGRYDHVLLDPGSDAAAAAVPVLTVTQPGLPALLESLPPAPRAWAAASRFGAKAGEVCLMPGEQGGLARVLLGLGPGPAPAEPTPASPPAPAPAPAPGPEPWAFSPLAKLPPGAYRLEAGAPDPGRAALGFLLGHYTFERYKKQKRGEKGGDEKGGEGGGQAGAGAEVARLVWPDGCDRPGVLALARSWVWARNLITCPAEHMGPQHLAAEAAALAAEMAAEAAAAAGATHGSAAGSVTFRLIQGEQLLEAGYPAVHTVGRAAERPPAMITLEWSPPASGGSPDPAALPLVALVGKGVCFDTGGLDLKPPASMRLMKKDMGGAALTLALARLVAAARLPVRLWVGVPAVENAVGGGAFRPGDVLATRAGISVENGNTDAEGRLILADALHEAVSHGSAPPHLLLDAATLTGAARAALGPELPAVFTNREDTWRALERAAAAESDPLWRLPLHAPYRKLLDSKVADMGSVGGEGAAGAVVAALFLKEFVGGAPRWVHVDTGAYTTPANACPGRPEGGEALGLRALWRLLRDMYGGGSGAAGGGGAAAV